MKPCTDFVLGEQENFCVHLKVNGRCDDVGYVIDKLSGMGISTVIDDPLSLLEICNKIKIADKGPEQHEIIFRVTIDSDFNREFFDAILLDWYSVEVCRDLLENVGFDAVCHDVVKKSDAINCCAVAVKREALGGKLQMSKVFLKPVQKNVPQKIIDIKKRISSYDAKLDSVFTNGIDPVGSAISVVIPAYNREDLIIETLRSVVSSDCDVKYELVIVNDASTDSTELICKNFITQLKIPAKVVTKHTNCHLSHSRNVGIDHSNGEYIFFLDSDNLILSNCLQLHYESITTTRSTVCYAPIRKFRESHGMKHMLHDMSNSPFDFERMITANYIDAMAMVRKEDIVSAGKYATWLLHFGIGFEDYELWLRLNSIGKKFHFIETPYVSIYRLHEGNMINECGSDGAVPYKIVMNNYGEER